MFDFIITIIANITTITIMLLGDVS